ncbi:MAG: tRNA pseudouridine(38-40) synthase TruA [Treponemataceae bacterium]|nr:tRNA pseudouridine(38-40) synthase TruA [Treponemataceae bacterium]
MRTILLTLSYDGTDFCGWQRQNDCETGHARTVQEELEKVLAQMHKQPVQAAGSGRTDSGVHAMGQAVTFVSPIDSIPVQKYPAALNSLLPHDIRIMSAAEVPDGFHARFSATRRSYRYFMWCDSPVPASEMRYVWPLFRQPDVEKLNRMASCLQGEIDCTTFSAAGDKSPSKKRYLEKAHFYMDGPKLVFEISANAFLWRMVRSITGTLIQAEQKGKDDDYIRRILEAKDRKLAGITAPANGLFLWEVGFDGIRRGPTAD